MAPKLYMIDLSPPVRSVLMTAEALGITLEHVPINLANQEHLTPEYLKLNPQHTVPTLDDDGKVIWDSHAINVYLFEKYGKDDSLYPKDPYLRAIINQRLHFDSGVLFPAGIQIVRPIVREGAKSVPPEKSARVIEAYEFLEKFLEGRLWAAGNDVTLADFNLLPSVTSIAIVVPIDENKFPNITAWIQRAHDLPYYDANQKGLDNFKGFILGKLNG